MNKKIVKIVFGLILISCFSPQVALAENSSTVEQTANSDSFSPLPNEHTTSSFSMNIDNSTIPSENEKMVEESDSDNNPLQSGVTERTSESYKSDEKKETPKDSIDDWMPDKNLQKIVAEKLGKTNFTQTDLLDIKDLTISNATILDAKGSSFAKNLKNLTVIDTDLSQTKNMKEIGTLKNLENLTAVRDNLSDISFIKNNDLVNLKDVDLSYNSLTNLNSIAGINLPSLEKLDISHNLLDDISIIENVKTPKLHTLIASYNRISDISSIAKSSLVSLEKLDASNNLINNVNAFANSTFTKLQYLIVNNNNISDISVMKNLKERYPSLHVYNVNNNHINSITFMEGYDLSSETSATNQLYKDNLSLIKPVGSENRKYKIPMPIISLDYQYDSVTGYYKGLPDPTAQTLQIRNFQNIDAVELFNGKTDSVDTTSVKNSVKNLIIDRSREELPQQISLNWIGAKGQYTGTAIINVDWLEAQPPYINATDKTIYVGDKFNPLDGVTAYDLQKDGSDKVDLTKKIDFTGSVDSSKEGVYPITYKVTNSYGLNMTKTINISVLPNKQSINGNNLTMYLGDKVPTVVDFKATATGKNGNSIPVRLDLSKVNFKKTGVYDVVLNTDDGQKKIVKLTILEKKLIQYTVTFKTDGHGSLSGSTTVKVDKGAKLSTVPTVKADKGYVFEGWYTSDNKKIDPNAQVITKDAVFTAKFKKQVIKKIALYRLYNPNSGEHFYTQNAVERDKVKRAGWRYEGIGWYSPEKGTPVYRLYNPNVGDHLYTLNSYERDNLKSKGWRYEGIGWYSGGNVPVYREYNPNAKIGTHNYTVDQAENNHLIKVGWRYEGISWYSE